MKKNSKKQGANRAGMTEAVEQAEKKNKRAQPLVVGIDIGDKVSRYAVLGEGKEFAEQGQFASTRQELEKKFGQWSPARMVLEAGTHSRWMTAELKRMGHEVILANPRELKALTGSTKKNDAEDARKLSRIARADEELLKPVQLRSDEAQLELLKLQTREAIVRVRAGLTSTIRGLVKGFGERVRRSTTQGFVEAAEESLPEPLQKILQPMLDVIELEQRVRDHPVASKLDQVPGVGPVTAMAYVLTIDDPARFKKSRKVGSYLGLTPWSQQSGESDPQLGITKAGNEFLRRLLVQCAHRLLGPQGRDCAIRRWGLHLSGDGKNKRLKKRAVVAVARKLAVLLHVLWVSGEEFQAFPRGCPDQRRPLAA
jgi:transposase